MSAGARCAGQGQANRRARTRPAGNESRRTGEASERDDETALGAKSSGNAPQGDRESQTSQLESWATQETLIAGTISVRGFATCLTRTRARGEGRGNRSSLTISAKPGWSWGCVLAVDSNGRTIWIADAHRGDGKRFVVRADEKLTAFVELESGIWVQRIVSTSWPDFFQTPDHVAGSSAAAYC